MGPRPPRRRGLLASSSCAFLLLLASATQPHAATAQSFAGCSSTDVHQLSWVGRGMMGCFSLSLTEVFMFMGGMSAEQKAWLDQCSKSSDKYQSDCVQLLESFLQQAASQPGSLPAKIVGNVYKNPPGVLNCVAALNKDVGSFSSTCSDGVMLGQLTQASSLLAPYVNQIQPWHFPPQMEGCAVNDLLNLQLAYLPFIDCLNFNFTQLVGGFTTGGGPGMGQQLEDATIRAAIDCLYDPHISNSECMYLVIVASTKLQGGSWADMGIYAMRALTDYPQACQCVRGATQSAAYQAVPKTCAAQDALNFLTALEASCAFEPQIQSSLSKALNGCSDADVVRSELVGIQLLDCMGATAGDLAGSSQALDEARIAQVANCVNDPGYGNADCLALLGSLAKIAASQPDSLEAQMVAKMTQDGAAFCDCIDAAARSPPTVDLAPTCDVPYTGIHFLQDNKKYCNTIAAVPPSFWAAAAAGIAATAKAPLTPAPPAADGVAEVTPGGGGEVGTPTTTASPAGQPAAVPKESSLWDYLPDMPDFDVSYADLSSMMSYFGATETAGGQPKLVQDKEGKYVLQEEHPHLRFKGNAQKQSRNAKTAA